MSTLDRSLALLRRLNAARLRFSGWAGGERVTEAERALELHDDECKAAGQMSLLAYTPEHVVEERPSACEECGCYAPADFATRRGDQFLWLCPRCRDGRLSDDARRQLSIYERVHRRRSA